MIKPRITIAGPMQYSLRTEYSEYGKRKVLVPFWFWKCEGNGQLAYGSSPYNAYRSWEFENKQNTRFIKLIRRWLK